jgi:hypothetical protein
MAMPAQTISEDAGKVARTGNRTELNVEAITDAATWDRLLDTAPLTQLVQGHAYGEAKATKGWRVRRVVLRDGQAPVALCQILERRVLGLRVVSRINRGPLLLSANPSPETILAVYRTIRQGWGRWYSGPLSIAPGLEDSPEHHALLRKAGFRLRKAPGWWSARIDLTRPEEAIRAGLASTFRNRLRAAERSELTLRVANDAETVTWMIDRHVANMEDKRFNALDADFLAALAKEAPGNVTIFQALLDGNPVAGMSVMRFGRVAEYHVGWFGPEARGANAGNFLMWSILTEMKRRGCTLFDVGGLYEGHGYTQFKRGMRGTEYRLVGEWVAF